MIVDQGVDLSENLAMNKKLPAAVESSDQVPTAAPVVGSMQKLIDFTDQEHETGLQLAHRMPTTVLHMLQTGQMLARVHASLCQRGRGSLWKKFCHEYLPAMDRKTLDRWRLAFDKFKNLLEDTKSGKPAAPLGNVRLTALYRLTKSDASDGHRRAALVLAERGITVTEKLAASLVAGDSPRSSSPPRKQVKSLVNGAVEVRSDDGNFLTVLKAALEELEQLSRTPAAHVELPRSGKT